MGDKLHNLKQLLNFKTYARISRYLYFTSLRLSGFILSVGKVQWNRIGSSVMGLVKRHGGGVGSGSWLDWSYWDGLERRLGW